MLFSARHRRFLPLLLVLLLASSPPIQSACSQLERGLLLSFLSNVSSTPNVSTIFSSWGVDKGDCCHWDGISCGGDGGSITGVSLPVKGLKGSISPSLANLTHLAHLNLSHNRLSGELPPALLSSASLTVLDVSFNLLTGGLLLAPSTPTAGSSSYSLKVLNASSNSLTGAFPSTACARFPLLGVLDLSRNQFDGGIGRGFGHCSQLTVFKAGNNNLSGSIPADLFDAASLTQLALPSNQISGGLDGVRLLNLSDLTMLDLSNNGLIGPIPDSIGKLAKLESLLLFSNHFTGAPPLTLANCTKLKSLNLRANNLVGELSAVDFSPLSDLSTLDLGNNNFTGEIPGSLFKCRSLTALRLSHNSLYGQIPAGLANLTALSYLSLSYNKFANITAAFQVFSGCSNLTAILLAHTFIGEAMPDDHAVELMGGVGPLSLRILALANSNLTGQVPSWLSKFNKLEALDLSKNRLVGPIPAWIGTMSRLFYLDLSRNRLTGGFPLEITKLPMLLKRTALVDPGGYLALPLFVTPTNSSSRQYNQLDQLPPAIYLESNSLSGPIPAEIGQMKALFVLDLSDNGFSGEIPMKLCDLINLELLNLSSNRLSGKIPPAFNQLSFLSTFNVAYNELVGPIPTGPQFDSFPNSSFDGNPGLCGSAIGRSCNKNNSTASQHRRRCISRWKIIGGAILGVCIGVTFGLSYLVFRTLSSSRRAAEPQDEEMDLPSSMTSASAAGAIKDAHFVMAVGESLLTLSDILKATGDFDEANIIGCGGFGVVYIAKLPNGTKLAVKRLSSEISVMMEREFKAEVEALFTAQHANLVTLRGYCMQGGLRLLMYTYMENGSLDECLHDRYEGSVALDWPAKLKIAQGTGRGLAYIHQTGIVHRDIKSSNILLDHDLEPHIADFGLARLILPYDTHVTTELVGTLGYIPPEYGQSWVATLKGDIFSFGVVLLELLTGRRPVDVFMPKSSRELVAWVQEKRLQGKHEEVFDPLMRGKGFEEQMLWVLDVACMCVHHSPSARPSIQDVVAWLDNINGGSHRKPETTKY